VAKFVTAARKFLTRKEEGATAVEYGIMIAAIAAAIVVTVIALGTTLEAAFTYLLTQLGNLTT
jgi:pilus assembly protein Flp/PilA